MNPPTDRVDEPIVQLHDVVKHYRTRGRGTVHAMDGVTLSIAPGETLGLVGESGCGKSTTARLLVQLERPTSGRIVVDGTDLGRTGPAQRRRLRRTIQMVFQDPYASLDPRVRVGDAIAEVLTVHRLTRGAARRRERVAELLEMVGLAPAAGSRFPHELSGGQRQRIGIARALAVQPKILVLDEAVSALDVSVRAEVMNLLARLRRELGLTYLFISHDLGMVRHISDRIAVMYLGQIVEVGPWQPVSDRPAHPYTVALQNAVPVADPAAAGRALLTVAGEVPDAARPPAGCRFHPRCPLVEQVCRDVPPALAPLRFRAVGDGGGDGGAGMTGDGGGSGGSGGGSGGDGASAGIAASPAPARSTAPAGSTAPVGAGALLVSCHVVQRERRTATDLIAAAEGSARSEPAPGARPR